MAEYTVEGAAIGEYGDLTQVFFVMLRGDVVCRCRSQYQAKKIARALNAERNAKHANKEGKV